MRNTLALQSKVARAVAEQIRLKLSSQQQNKLKSAPDVNAEAHEAYLKGRFFWNKRTGEDLRRAVAYFNQAIEKEPNYAQAYSGLADSYALMGDWECGALAPKVAFPKARAAALKLWRSTTRWARHTPLSRFLWTSSTGTGSPQRRNIEEPFNSVRTMRRPIR